MVKFEELNEGHKNDVMSILNYYVENTYAAYSEKSLQNE
jgi:L-amino acid N-acyltransferase YncA